MTILRHQTAAVMAEQQTLNYLCNNGFPCSTEHDTYKWTTRILYCYLELQIMSLPSNGNLSTILVNPLLCKMSDSKEAIHVRTSLEGM